VKIGYSKLDVASSVGNTRG